jgi:hypothetical protein
VLSGATREATKRCVTLHLDAHPGYAWRSRACCSAVAGQ